MAIRWQEWSAEAFSQAQREDKPVFLDISATWCHWCHVLDRTTLSDPAVIAAVNADFIPVRVDTDKRPDINERYNQGGWPTVALLSPTGKLISGGTYLPPQHMLQLLKHVTHSYKERKTRIEQTAFRPPELRPATGLGQAIVDDVADLLLSMADTEHGGFGHEPKFPLPEAIEFCMLRYLMAGDKNFLKLTTLTLNKMVQLADPVESGFYRYSVTADWRTPHYEKMLETNAQLASTYLRAYLITADDAHRAVAESTLRYMIQVLSDGKERFYGSQDADGEDAYYGKAREERDTMETPAVDRTSYTSWSCTAISALLAASAACRNSDYKKRALSALEFLLRNCYDAEQGVAHYYDSAPAVYGLLADNAAMIQSLLDAYEAAADTRYLDHAEQLTALVTHSLKSDAGYFDRPEGGDGMLAFRHKPLGSNALMARVLLRLAFITGNSGYKNAAVETLRAFSGAYKDYSVHAADYAAAVAMALSPVELSVPEQLRERALRYPDPRRMIRPQEGDAIVLCVDGTCMKLSGEQTH